MRITRAQAESVASEVRRKLVGEVIAIRDKKLDERHKEWKKHDAKLAKLEQELSDTPIHLEYISRNRYGSKKLLSFSEWMREKAKSECSLVKGLPTELTLEHLAVIAAPDAKALQEVIDAVYAKVKTEGIAEPKCK